MEKVGAPNYLTATSLTARQINRNVILNIIYAQQPISRADTARVTGLQRSTVSLIVDELIADGWIVEGEYHRIPRGRRPIFLQINSANAGLVGVHINRDSAEVAVADLNGQIQWTGKQNYNASSTADLRNTLRELADKARQQHNLQIKGVGAALENVADEDGMIREALASIFKVPIAIEPVPVACGRWFMIFHKDARLAQGHLVAVHASTEHLALGVIIAGKPLRGAHRKAGRELSDAAGAAKRNGSAHAAATRSAEELAERMKFAVAAYDPGVILLTGEFATEDKMESMLSDTLAAANASDTALRVIDPESEAGKNIYVRAAVAVILGQFLDECPSQSIENRNFAAAVAATQ